MAGSGRGVFVFEQQRKDALCLLSRPRLFSITLMKELLDWVSKLDIIKYKKIMKYDDSHGELHYHRLAMLI